MYFPLGYYPLPQIKLCWVLVYFPSYGGTPDGRPPWCETPAFNPVWLPYDSSIDSITELWLGMKSVHFDGGGGGGGGAKLHLYKLDIPKM